MHIHASLVDKVEVKKLYSTFMELSNGGKESLSKEMFKKGLNKLEACGLKNIDNTPFADRLFHLLDINGDGTVDLSEFVCGLSMLCKGTVEEKLECMYMCRSLFLCKHPLSVRTTRYFSLILFVIFVLFTLYLRIYTSHIEKYTSILFISSKM